MTRAVTWFTRQLEDLFAACLHRSRRIALSAASGLGKTHSAEDFCRRHADRAHLLAANGDLSAMLEDIRTIILPPSPGLFGPETSEPMSTQAVLDDLRQTTGLRANLGSAPDPMLLIIDDAHTLKPTMLNTLLRYCRDIGDIRPFGVALLGNQHWVLPSNLELRPEMQSKLPSRTSLELLDADFTITGAFMDAEDRREMARTLGASEDEWTRLNELCVVGRLDSTFADYQRAIRRIREGRPTPALI